MVFPKKAYCSAIGPADHTVTAATAAGIAPGAAAPGAAAPAAAGAAPTAEAPIAGAPPPTPKDPVALAGAARVALEPFTDRVRREGVTLFMLLLSGYQVLLSRLSGQTDVCVGIPVAGRTRRELEGLIGFFINAVVIRMELGGKPRLTDYLQRLKERTLGAYGHQDVPAELLLEALKVERNLSYGPLAQVGFTLQNVPHGEGFKLGGVEAQVLEYGQVTAKYDLTVLLKETENGLEGVAEYATDLFEAATVETFMAYYREILEQMVALPSERRLSAIVLPEEETLREELGLPSHERMHMRGEDGCCSTNMMMNGKGPAMRQGHDMGKGRFMSDLTVEQRTELHDAIQSCKDGSDDRIAIQRCRMDILEQYRQ